MIRGKARPASMSSRRRRSITLCTTGLPDDESAGVDLDVGSSAARDRRIDRLQRLHRFGCRNGTTSGSATETQRLHHVFVALLAGRAHRPDRDIGVGSLIQHRHRFGRLRGAPSRPAAPPHWCALSRRPGYAPSAASTTTVTARCPMPRSAPPRPAGFLSPTAVSSHGFRLGRHGDLSSGCPQQALRDSVGALEHLEAAGNVTILPSSTCVAPLRACRPGPNGYPCRSKRPRTDITGVRVVVLVACGIEERSRALARIAM